MAIKRSREGETQEEKSEGKKQATRDAGVVPPVVEAHATDQATALRTMKNSEIDEDLHSRQLAVYGR